MGAVLLLAIYHRQPHHQNSSLSAKQINMLSSFRELSVPPGVAELSLFLQLQGLPV